MDRDELIENLRTTLLWETVCAHIESRNEADVLFRKAGMENGVAAECAEIQDSEDFFVTDICESGGRLLKYTFARPAADAPPHMKVCGCPWHT